MEGEEVLARDRVEARGGGVLRGEELLAEEEERHLDLGDRRDGVVAPLERLPGALLGEVEPVLREGGLRERLHQEVEPLGQVLLLDLEVEAAARVPAAARQGRREGLEAVLDRGGVLLLRPADGELRAEEAREALLARGLHVGAAPPPDADADERDPRRVGDEVGRDLVLQDDLRVLRLRHLERERRVGQLLGAVGDRLAEGAGGRDGEDKGGALHEAVHPFTSGAGAAAGGGAGAVPGIPAGGAPGAMPGGGPPGRRRASPPRLPCAS